MLFRSDLEQLGVLKIQHRALAKDTKDTELHDFFDASKKIYEACVYLRSPIEAGKWEAHTLRNLE